MTTLDRDRPGADALSCWFGLSRANYLAVPRSLLEQMPDEWQGRMAALLTEMGETFTWPTVPEVAVEVRLRRLWSRQYVSDPLAEYRHPDPDDIAAARTKP